jgi:hypothetical protein
MNKKIILALGLLALALAGCATAPTVGPWGYDFSVVRIEDARPDDDAKLMAVVPFDSQSLISAWQRAVPRAGWGAIPAELAVRVTQYEATHSGSSYALSMRADLVGRGGDPAPSYRPAARPIVAQVPGQCVAYASTSTGKGQRPILGQVFGANVPQGKPQNAPTGLGALTVSGRDATLWQDLWTQCATQLATQLGNALMAVPPQVQPDTRGH